MKWVSIGLLATLTTSAAALAEEGPEIADCFGIKSSKYKNDDERAGALLNCVEALATKLIPEGAVMAFDLPNGCPEGWSRFNEGSGRMIVGVGKRVGVDGSFRLLADSRGSVYDQGGAETHELELTEMPAHGHRISTDHGRDYIHDGLAGFSHAPGSDYGILDNFSEVPNKPNWTTVLPNVLEKTGGLPDGTTKPHNNMPPYIALYYCKKE